MTTVIYCRISLDRTGEELGVQRQEQECRALCEEHGWDVSEVIVDNDLSATKGKRPGFEQLLSSPPSRIVCWHTDRLVRLSRDLERVLDLSIPVYTVASGYLDLSNPAGRAVARTITAWATYEGEQKAARQRAAHAQRRASGGRWWMHKPFGYTLDGELVEEEAQAIRKGILDVLDGKAIRQVAREWEEQGFRSSRGNVMLPSVVRDILTHPRNAGKITYKGDVVGDGDWDPIVDELTLYAVRRLVAQPERKLRESSTRRGLLTGLLWCGICGGRVHLHRANKRNYYTCSEKHCVSWPIDWLEEYVSTTVMLVLDDPEWRRGWDLSDEENQTAAQREVDRLEELVDQLMDDRLDGKITQEQWERVNEKAQERLSRARSALGTSASTPKPSEALRTAYRDSKRWDTLNVDQQREVIATVYPKITLGRSGRTRWRAPDSKAVRLHELK